LKARKCGPGKNKTNCKSLEKPKGRKKKKTPPPPPKFSA